MARSDLDWSPADCDITVTFGDETQPVAITLTTSDSDGSNPVPWNPTTVLAQVREGSRRNTPLVMDLEPTFVDNVVSLAAGLPVLPEQGDGVYRWDLQVDGLTVTHGRYRILPDVSVEGS